MVSLNLYKDYLVVATVKIPVLLLRKSWTFWYVECLPASSYAGVTYFLKWSNFLTHTV